MDPLTPIEPPPPAYSEEQQALDRKISDALEQSLRISQPSSSGEDAWEEWDDAKFEAAARTQEHRDFQVPHRSLEKERLAREDAAQARAASSGASSSRSNAPHVRTGSLGRRLPASPPANTSTKERPSWFAQAQLDREAPAPTQVHHIPPEEDEPDEQLPAFAAVGPSLEGPPFEEVVRVQRRTNVAAGDSPPLSPLDSVDGSNSPPSPPAWAPLRPTPRGSYFPESVSSSPPPRVPHAIRTSPAAAVSPRQPRPPPPPMPFDTSTAYAKPRTVAPSSGDSPTGTVDAAALYNSAVSSFMSGPSHSQLSKKTNTLNQGPVSSSGSRVTSYSSRTSDPYAPRVADPYARQASDSYGAGPSPSGPEPFPSQGSVYSPYSPQQTSHPPQQSMYPPQQLSYPPQQPSYPQQQLSYPQQQPSYPQPQPSYPQTQPSYPQPQSSYSPQHQLYPPQQQQHVPQGYSAPAASGPTQVTWASHPGGGPGYGH